MTEARVRPPAGWPPWLNLVLVGSGAALLPWLVVLAVTLPGRATVPHWPLAWLGLDAIEAVALITTGRLLRRRDPRCCLAAAAAAMLLITDAWFDVATAASGRELVTALIMAAGAELPMAALCLTLAIRTAPRSLDVTAPKVDGMMDSQRDDL